MKQKCEVEVVQIMIYGLVPYGYILTLIFYLVKL